MRTKSQLVSTREDVFTLKSEHHTILDTDKPESVLDIPPLIPAQLKTEPSMI